MENKVSCQTGVGEERKLASLFTFFSQLEGTVKEKKICACREKEKTTKLKLTTHN